MAEASFLRSFTFNGQKTSHLFQIEKISIPFLSKENEYYEVGNTNGSNFFHTRVSKNSIKIDGYLLKDNSNMTIYKIKDELVKILNTDEPVKLVFDQLPDRYFNAIFNGSVDHDVTNPDQTSVSLTFDVPDGLAHQIEPSGFTNVYTTEKNLFLDSEFEKIDKYLKPWVFKVDELNNGSAVVSADFTSGVPIDFERDDNQRWLQVNSMTRRKVDNLSKNSSIAFSIDAWVTQIDEEDKDPNAGALILEEWTTDPANIVERHIVPIPKKVGTGFEKFGTVVRIKNPKTTALNLAFGFNGSNIIKWSQPMFTVLEEIPEPVPETIVGATLFSNSLDFGDYDYSTAPNLMPTLSYKDISTSWTQEHSAPIPPSKEQVVDNGDYFTVDLSKVTGNFGLYFNNLPRPQAGKEYTWSVEVMSDEPLANNFFFIRPVYVNAGGALSAYASPINTGATTNMVRYSRKYTNITDVISNSNCQSLQLYFTKELPRTKVHIRYNMMIQEGDQTSSQAPANQMPKITTDDYMVIQSAITKTGEEGNITSFNNLPTSDGSRNIYVRNDEGTKKLIPLLSDKKQYTMSVEMWSEKEVTPSIRYRVNDINNTPKLPLDIYNKKIPAKQWTELSVTKTLDLPSNPNLVPTLKASDFYTQNGGTIEDSGNGLSVGFTKTDGAVWLETRKSMYPVKPNTNYTMSADVTISEGYKGSLDNLRITYRKFPNGTIIIPLTCKDAQVGKKTKISITVNSSAVTDPSDFERMYLAINTTSTDPFIGTALIENIKVEEGEAVTPDYPQHWLHIAIPREYEGIIKIKNDSIKIQEGATTTKPAWKPNLLAEPYEVGDVPVQPNIANKETQFPIKTSEYLSYIARMVEPFVVGETYTITIKATKPVSQTFMVYNIGEGTTYYGNLKPVDGLTDVWSLTFTPSNVSPTNPSDLRIFQYPSSTKGAVQIDWLKIEKGDKRTPNHDFYKYRGLYSYPSPDPNDYAWEYDPTYYKAIDYEQSREGVSDVLLVQNNGTYRTYPKFTFKMNGENGLVGLLNGNGGVLQFGNPEDVDGTTSVRTEQGLNENYWGNTLNPNIKVNTGFKSVYPNMNSNPSTPNIIQGSLDMKQDADSVVPVFKGVGDINVWHGPTMMMDIQAPANNDRTGEVASHIRFTFNNYDKGQRGRIEFSIFDENGDPAMTTVIRDSTAVGNEMRIECWYKGKRLIDQALDRKTFSKTFYEINMDRRGNRLIWRLVQIKKLNTGGQWSTAQVDKEYKFTWNLDEPDTTKWTKLGIWQMRYSNKFHVLMGITDAQVRWEKTPYYQDIKNYFQDGDLVEIDVKGRALYVNGSINNDLNVVGNQWEKFVLELGETMIQPVVSDWANMAEVTATIEESYL